MKIGIMGYYPPPIGGISMHVLRLEKLLASKNIDYHIYAIGKADKEDDKHTIFTNRRRWALSYFLSPKEDILHCHTMGWSERAYYGLMAKLFGKKIVYTFHSYRDRPETLGLVQRASLDLVRKIGNAFIAVGQEDYQHLLEDGFDEKRLSHIPGFVAPTETDEALPEEVNNFVQRHDVILTANASNMNRINGQDLYGIDLCIDLVKEWYRQKEPVNVGFVFYLGQISDKAYYEKLRDELDSEWARKHFLLFESKVNYYPMIKACDIFLRTTNTDGDAISIREALYAGKPVIASDVVTRPGGVTLYKNRDAKDLYTKVKKVIEEKCLSGDDLTPIEVGEDFGLRILELYNKLNKGQGNKTEETS